MVITTNPLIKSDQISVPITAGSTQTKLPFPDQPQLRSVFLQSIFMPFVTFDYYGQTTLNQGTDLLKGFLVLYFEGKENIQQMPLSELIADQHSTNSYNVNGYLGFFNQQIVWPKSYILLASPIAPASNYVFTFAVNYSLQKI